jgi:hypothetical protein
MGFCSIYHIVYKELNNTMASMQKGNVFLNEMNVSADADDVEPLLPGFNPLLQTPTVPCGCFDGVGFCTCCLASIIPCYYQYTIAALVQQSKAKHRNTTCIGDPNVPGVCGAIGCVAAMLSGQVWLGNCIPFLGLMSLAEPCTTMFQKAHLNNIEPDYHTCCQSCFCSPCLITQNLNTTQKNVLMYPLENNPSDFLIPYK